MNIFILDENPILAAQYHCDRHIVKMITESLQMLASTHWYSHGITKKKDVADVSRIWKDFPRIKDDKLHPYGIGFMNHPCTKWIRDSTQNWEWTISLCDEITHEHYRRWGRYTNAIHILKWFKEHRPDIPDIGLTPFVKAMPDEYKVDNVVESYRKYYIKDKAYFATWKNQTPKWWNHENFN